MRFLVEFPSLASKALKISWAKISDLVCPGEVKTLMPVAKRLTIVFAEIKTKQIIARPYFLFFL